MATIKSYSDLSQSKKLAEILPIDSADMYWWYSGRRYYIEAMNNGDFNENSDIRAWSLASLLSILPNNEHIDTTISRGSWKIDTFEYMPNTWWCEYEDNNNPTYFNTSADNPVDACVDMIIKLKEQNLL